MRLQPDSYSCGAMAIVNACKALGMKCDVNRVRKLAQTDPQDGTDEHGVQQALTELGLQWSVLEGNSDQHFWALITEAVRVGDPVIVCVDGVDHWLAVVGALGADRVVVFDSERTGENLRENGVWTYDAQQMADRCATELGQTWRYAIRVRSQINIVDGQSVMDVMKSLNALVKSGVHDVPTQREDGDSMFDHLFGGR